ncbi:hypothetical protein [Glycomyces terrestris]|uniref:Uncharacterized protein n=1 Tax=Glycomyces terrestris TaxID=2493553 RepID=A0A426V0W5_9ACTN|nr:hypothetical protein [Glycomyces terrestris]RRS00486.1 hypothetical protein EIW28_07955 [Glycomyces terrestris]
MAYQNTRPRPNAAAPDPLERGGFGDGSNRYTVYASSAEVPDSFQVCANGNRADLVLIVSGLTSQNLHATWGDEWRNRTAEWREWARATAFHVFYNGSPQPQAQTRFCDG